MAITNMDQLVAALGRDTGNTPEHESFHKASATSKGAGTYHSLWAVGGQPGAAAYPGASVAWSLLTKATAGSPDYTNPTSANTYLAHLSAVGSVGHNLILYDRLAQTGALTGTTTANTFTGQPTLTRTADALGADVELWIEYITATTTSVTVTATYTDQAGATGNSATVVSAAASAAGQMQPFNLAAGDTGVRSVQSDAHATMTAGTYQLVLMRRLAEIPIPVTNSGNVLDAFDLGMPRVYDDSCLALMMVSGAVATGIIHGSVLLAKG